MFSTDSVDLVQTLVNWIPDNAAAAFGNFNIIQVIIFSLFLGIAIAVLPNDLPAKDGLQVSEKRLSINDVEKAYKEGIFSEMFCFRDRSSYLPGR